MHKMLSRQLASFLYCDGSLMQDILPVAMHAITVMCEYLNTDPCVRFVVSVVEILV